MKTTEKTVYFERDGNINFKNVIQAIKDYLQKDKSIKNVAVFAGKLESVMLLHEELKESNVRITVATYPFGKKFYLSDEEDSFIIPDVTTREAKSQILHVGMDYVQGGLPFDPIRSCTGDNSTEMIISAYETISKGLPHCISAAIMAYENGIVDESEKIISMSGDTAIVITPSSKHDMFCETFRIHKILCKPL